MSPLDLIRGRDGKMVLTKLAATTAHGLFAFTVVVITWETKEFDQAMWGLYIGCTIAHAAYDKTAAQVKDFKEKKMAADTGSVPLDTGAEQ